MFEYVALIAFILILSPIFFYKKRVRVVHVIFTIICFLALFCVSALRTRIGFDYLVYSRSFFKMGMDGFEVITYGRWEMGFVLLTKIIVYFTRDVRIYMAVLALISIAGPCFVICKYSKKVWLSVLLYINLYFFYLSMNFLRQSLALSITMFALPFLLKKKIFPNVFPYVAIVALAATFHKSALVMIPVFFISRIKASYKVPVTYFLLITPAFIFSDAIIDALGKFDILTRYAYASYRTTMFWLEGIDLIHGLIPTIVIATCICFTMKFAKHNKRLVIYSNLLYFSYIFTFIMLKHAILERVSYYAYIYVILYIPELLTFLDGMYKNHLNKKYNELSEKTINKDEFSSAPEEEIDNAKEGVNVIAEDTIKKYRRRRKMAALLLTAVVVIGTTSYNIYGLLAGEDGVHGVYPYQSWLYESSDSAGK